MKVSRFSVNLWPGGRPRDFTGHSRVRWVDGDLVPVGEGDAPDGAPEARPQRRIGRARRRPTEEEMVGIFEKFREVGICPHPYDDDHELARTMVRRWEAAGDSRGKVDAPDGVVVNIGESLLTEEHVEPFPGLGIVNPRGFIETSENVGNVGEYNDFAAEIADIAQAGCGRVRHVNQADLDWEAIQALCADYREGDLDIIPRPDKLYERLIAGRYRAFRCFTLYWLQCCLKGVQMNPILFCKGGGSTLNDNEAVYFYEDQDGSTQTIPRRADGDEGPGQRSVEAGRPDHQQSILVASWCGWDPFYWDPAELNAEGSQEATDFQRFAVNVWVADDASPYMREAARRKSLAIAAFGKAVGEYLAKVDRAMGILREFLDDATLGDVIPYVEFGNEMNVFWAPGPGSGIPVKDAAMEMGRFCALLAGPIREACPGIRFKLPDITYYRSPEEWEANVEWLTLSVTLGIREEVARWNVYNDGGPPAWDLPAQVEWSRWLASSATARFSWPSGSSRFAATDLAHCAGLHLFVGHTHEVTETGIQPREAVGYLDEIDMGDLVRTFTDGVYRMGQGHYPVQWAVGAVDFPAMIPSELIEGDVVYLGRDDERVGTNPMYQAGILARRILYLWMLRPEFILWYTFTAGTQEMGSHHRAWATRYEASGIRNDTYTSDRSDLRRYDQYVDPDPLLEGFQASRHAWRRPAWFTLRRVAWLLGRTQQVSEAFSDRPSRLVILRLTARAGQPYRQPDMAAGATYTYAYVAWMDEMSPSTEAVLSIVAGRSVTFEASSLVPDVTGVPWREGDPQDLNRYPDIETAHWRTWRAPFGTAPSTLAQEDGAPILRVLRAHPESNPAPLFFLCDQSTLIFMIVRQAGSIEGEEENRY